jgi:hypothetical protein
MENLGKILSLAPPACFRKSCFSWENGAHGRKIAAETVKLEAITTFAPRKNLV